MKGHALHRWTDADGNDWACAASDHGPFCRLCKQVPLNNEILRALLDNVDEGLLMARMNVDGEFEFQVTDAGNKRVGEILGGASN